MSNMGIQYVKKSDQESECLSAAKPPAYEIELGFPLVSLTDRQFEFLLHDVFNADLAEKKVEDRFDTVLLMLGVAERGRDCALLKAGKHVGVIQCKRYESLLTKPDVVREILKFILHAIKDPRLLPDPTNFLYVFATSRDFNGATKELLANFNESVLKEPKLKEWTVEVIEGYETLKDLVYDKIRDELISILGKIKVTPLNGNDINTKLVGRSTIIQKYFTVKKVIAEENLDELKKWSNWLPEKYPMWMLQGCWTNCSTFRRTGGWMLGYCRSGDIHGSLSKVCLLKKPLCQLEMK